ncbi:MAG: Crp/Fnr family transcriptional regulator [Planctomycetota bacterium]
MRTLLRALPLFRAFSGDVLDAMLERAETRALEAGEVLFRVGDPGERLYLVEQGEIAVRRRDQTLAVLRPGQLLGEMAFLEQGPRSADAVARVPSTVRSLDNETFRAFLLDHPEGGAVFLHEAALLLSRRLRETSAYLTTVFETGRIVGAGLSLETMAARLLERLVEDIAGATGAVMLVRSPFTGDLDVAGRMGEALAEDAAVALAERHGDGTAFQEETPRGHVLGAPLLGDGDAPLGHLLLLRPADAGPFSPDQEVVVAAVGRQTGLGVLQAFHRQEEEARERLQQARMRRR